MEPIKRFLCIDEEEDHTTFFKVLLREKQYQEVTTTRSPKQALSIIEAKRIQFVITAWEMDEQKGTVMVQAIKAKRHLKHLPCLLFSKTMSESAVRLAKEVGIHVLRCPLKKDEVWPILQELIRREESIDPIEQKLRGVEAMLAEGQHKQALHTIKDCLAPGPSSARANTLLAEILMTLEELGKAEKAAEAALSAVQNYNPAMQLLAKVYSRTERHDKAITMLVQMADASPENITTLLNLGATYSDVGELHKAKLTLARVKELDPDNRLADDELGKIAVKEGNIDLAHKFLAESENAEELGRFFNNLGVGLVGKQDFDSALRTYEAGINILADKANLHALRFNLGLAFRKMGEYDKAFTVLAACYLAEPAYTKAYDALVRLVREMERKNIPYDKEITRRIQEARREAC